MLTEAGFFDSLTGVAVLAPFSRRLPYLYLYIPSVPPVSINGTFLVARSSNPCAVVCNRDVATLIYKTVSHSLEQRHGGTHTGMHKSGLPPLDSLGCMRQQPGVGVHLHPVNTRFFVKIIKHEMVLTMRQVATP